MNPILILPGHLNSGVGHWQSLWEDAMPEARRVEMPNWECPILGDWGAQFVELGPCGHLNAASGHGPWPRGEALLAELR